MNSPQPGLPVLSGLRGKAWVYVHKPLTADQGATLRAWILDCPGQSPAWSQYLLGVVHLRPIEGVRPAVLSFDGATHEFMVVALDPKYPVRTSEDPAHHLTPVNVVHQEGGLTDEDAIRICDLCAEAVVMGRLPAEPPLPEMGQKMWAVAIGDTARHLRDGRHT